MAITKKLSPKQVANVDAQFANTRETEVERLKREENEAKAASKARRERLAALGVDLSERKLPDTPGKGGLVSLEVGDIDGQRCAVMVIRCGDGTERTKDGRPYLFQLSGTETFTLDGIGEVGLGGPWAVIGKAAKSK